MAYPMGKADKGALRLNFDRRLMLQFRGSTITSDGGLLAYRELDDTLRLTDTAANTLADARTGKNGRHRLAGLLRQSDHPTSYGAITPASAIRPPSWNKPCQVVAKIEWHPGELYPRAALSSPTWRGPLRASSPSITSNQRGTCEQYIKARVRSNGPGYH